MAMTPILAINNQQFANQPLLLRLRLRLSLLELNMRTINNLTISQLNNKMFRSLSDDCLKANIILQIAPGFHEIVAVHFVFD